MAQVLIIDDDADTRNVLQTILTRAGHSIRTAGEGTEALLMLAEVPADIILTDIFMPATDGLELIREVRASHPTTKIIAVTGYPGLGDPLSTAKEIGADITLRKPIDFDQLLRALEDVMKEPKDSGKH